MGHSGNHRIVSLSPAATSILDAIGASRHLVGVTKWCKEVAEVDGLPRLGDCWSLDTAQLIRLRPTLVLGGVPYKPETVAAILATGIPFLARTPRSLAHIYAEIVMLGQLVGRPAAARRLCNKMQTGFASIARRVPRPARCPLVYCEAWPHPRISSPPWVAEMVQTAGGRFAGRAGSKIDDQAVARANPDIIVLAWTAAGTRAKASTAMNNPRWRSVSAIRNHRVHVVQDEILNTPGPPLLRGARALLEILHGA